MGSTNYITKKCNGFAAEVVFPGLRKPYSRTEQKVVPRFIAALQDAIVSRWAGWPSVVFLASYIVLSYLLFSANPVSIYLNLFVADIVLSPTITTIGKITVALLVVALGHKEMACGLAGKKEGYLLDAFNYGMAAALFALLVCYIPAAFLYLEAHAAICGAAILLCIVCILVARWMSLDIGETLWAYRWYGQLSRLIAMLAILQLLPVTIGVPAQAEIIVPEVKAERTLEANIDTAAAFFDGSWTETSLQERTNILANMMVVLGDYLGIENPPEKVIATTCMAPGTLGYYDRSGAGTIAVNAAYLMSEDPLVSLDTISHEAAHAFQWEAICAGGRPQESSYPYGVDEKKLNDYLIGYTNILPYEQRITEREAWEFGRHYSQIVSKKVCRYLQIEDPFAIDIDKLAIETNTEHVNAD